MTRNRATKTLSLFLAVLFLLSILAGCGRSDKDSSSESVEVMNETVLNDSAEDFLDYEDTTATSTLKGGGFGAENIADFSPRTVWAEGAYDEGAGECLMLNIPEGTTITGGMIIPGNYRSKKAFKEHAAPTRISISSGDSYIEVDLSKYASTYKNNFQGYHFKLKKSIVSDGLVKIFIVGTRSGSKYAHCCISELHLSGKEAKEPGQAATREEMLENNGDLFDLTSRLEGIYKNHMGWPGSVQDVTITAEELNPEDKAFALYQYQYFVTDARIHYDTDTTNKCTKSELTDIMNELFPLVTDEDMECFYEHYVKKIKKNTCKMNAVGDFGATDVMFFTDATSERTENGITIHGHIYRYSDDGTETYVGGQFTGEYELLDPNSGNYRFRSLTVQQAVG